MVKIGKYLPIVVLICIGFAFATADAQENLAQEVSAIFEQSCLICHGPHGPYTEQLVIQSRLGLVDTGTVIPGNPEGSAFYQRLIETAVEKRMPLGQPPLPPAAIQTIRQWIQAGAPDWNTFARTDIDFITTEEMLQTIENHVASLDPFDRSFARYFTSTHLYNAGEDLETLNAYQRALSKLVNSLSWGREVTKPQPIDSEATIFYIDLRDYEWELGINRWTLIETEYPYKVAFDAPTQTHLHEKLTNLRQEMKCEVPFVHVDWFLATASLPPLYHDILDLPLTDSELEARLEVNVTENIINAAGKRVWRAGFNESGVSNHNRIVERHRSRYGAYWKSYDFAGSAGSKNVLTHPINFTHDGGEIIFNLPNKLQAYYLIDASGNRLNEAPTEIVQNPATSDSTVRNGLSCIGCHTEGMKTFEDQVRGVAEQSEDPPFDKDKVLRLYVEKTVMDALVEEDTEHYRQALEATGDIFGGIEPVQRFHEAFQGPLDASHAAAAVGLETEVFLEKIRGSTSLQNLGLLVLENDTVKRDAWTSNFDQMISALNTDDSTLPPVVQRPELIPGQSVNIPDPNLRTAIAEALAKAPGDPITAEEMATLEQLYANGLGISDLTGLEFATNLDELEINENLMPDLSPLAGLTQLRGLRMARNKISDISPLTELKNLGALEIYDNEISDISPLAGLTNISWLSMYNNPVSDLSPLTNLKHLRGMRVSVKKPGDLSPIAELTNLEDLFYWGEGDPVPDLSPLTNLPKLRFIDIRGSGEPDLSPLARVDTLERFEFWGSGETIPDLSPLAESINLKELWVINCGITDLTFLENFIGLERLNLARNNISDVSPLAGLTNLKWLKLTNNPISDFSSLEVLSQNTNILTGEVAIPDPNLRAAIAEALGKENTAFVLITAEEMATLQRLDAPNKNISDLTGLAFAKNLAELYIPYNPLSDISPLASLAKLRRIWLHDTEVADLSPLVSLRDLEEINVAHTRISNLAPLAELKNLKKLDTIHSDISDLSPLAGLTNLTRLLLYDCKATNLSPLKGLTKLRWLGFPHTNNITDFSPLSGLTELRHLDLFHTEISDLSSLAKLINLETLILDWNRIVDVSPLASLHNLKTLYLHVNNIEDFSPLDGIRKNIEVFTWHRNPCYPQGGPKIEGPWLWLMLQSHWTGGMDQTDHLSKASNGKVTEQQIATLGAADGERIGDSVWLKGTLEPYNYNDSFSNRDNLRRLLLPEEEVVESKSPWFEVYSTITLDSPRTQQTRIFIGAADSPRKVLLNGELVYHYEHYVDRDAYNGDYQDFFPITLRKGKNVLLVHHKYNTRRPMGFFFGFEPGTEYSVVNPGVGYTFSDSKIHVGDIFTLDLSAENVFDLAGWQFDIAFDLAVLEAVEVNEGDFLKAEEGATFFQSGTIDNTAGEITGLSAIRFNEDGVSGTGTLLSVTFSAKAGGETQITLENFQLGSITGDVIPAGPHKVAFTIEGQLATGDVNRDGQVSILDMILVAKHFGEDASANPQADVNNDGVINIQDLLIVAQHLGESTDAAAPSAIVINDLDLLDPAMVQAWITQAQIEDDGSIIFQQGIATLERLLTLFIPEETALLHNYPNPFNPETWIPYQLADPAEVTLTIHSVNGTLVRTLALGHQPAGIYQTRTRAAYWDGKNQVGEPVASGIYFYTLTAGDFNATRKMLIRK